MRTVELYAAVRRAVFVEGLSQRDAARRFGLSRTTVSKMMQFSVPPGYRRRQAPRRPKLEPYLGIIDQILDQDTHSPRKQRHTAWRLFERLCDEYGFDGGYTIVKDYVREKRLHRQETFVPLAHPPGYAQADFGEADVIVAGVRQKAILNKAAANSKIKVVDLFNRGKLIYAQNPNLYAADFFHPSSDGYQIWARLFIAELAANP